MEKQNSHINQIWGDFPDAESKRKGNGMMQTAWDSTQSKTKYSHYSETPKENISVTQSARRPAPVGWGRAGVATGGLGLQTWGLAFFHMGIDGSLKRLGGPVSLIESRGMNEVNHRQSNVISRVLLSGKIIVIFWLHTPLPGTAQQHRRPILWEPHPFVMLAAA